MEVHGLLTVEADGTLNYPETSPVFDAVHQPPWHVSGWRPNSKLTKNQVKRDPNPHPIWMRCAKLFYRSVRWRELRRYKRYFEPLLREVDVVHLQSLFHHKHAFQWLLSNPDVPVVVSCFGSDVFRQSDLFVTLKQQQLLRFASAIIVSGNEFKEVVLSKYGRELFPKIHKAFFNPQVDAFVNSDKSKASQRFRMRLGVPKDRFIVCVGHNGTLESQHLKLIESIAALEESKKKSIFAVVPMTYGAGSEYQELVSRTLHETGLSGVVLREFLTEDELKDLRLATDILVYAPISDAFSASVTQALAAGSVAILGSWLPYKTRQRAGFKYWEIDAPYEACQVLECILNDWPEAQSQCEPNRKLSAEFFSQERLGQLCVDVYKSAIQNFKENSKSQRD